MSTSDKLKKLHGFKSIVFSFPASQDKEHTPDADTSPDLNAELAAAAV